MSRYSKAIAAALGALAVWGVTAVADGHVTAVEWFGLVAAAAAVIGVIGSPANEPKPPDEPAARPGDGYL